MSDFRDPREPTFRDPVYGGFNDPLDRNYVRESLGLTATLAWLCGIVLILGVMIYALGTSEGTRTAQYDAMPPVIRTTPPAQRPLSPPAVIPAPTIPGGAPSGPSQ